VSTDAATVAVEVRDPDADDEHLEELAARLRRVLLDLDVDAVERAPAGPVPDGAKAAGLAEIATLIVTLGNAAGGLGALVGAVRGWLGSGSSETRSVKLELDGDSLEVTGLSKPEQERLIEEWLSRQAARA
jgi:hypothetical protein